jgi:hypothetical protein
MPFAGYKDFALCVRKNQDKRSPEGYCAAIMRRVEGRPKKRGWFGEPKRHAAAARKGRR